MLLTLFKSLQFEEQMQKLVKSWASIDLNVKHCFQSFLTFCELVHCSEMDWVTFSNEVLLGKDFSVPLKDVCCVLLKETNQSQIKLSMSFDSISIVRTTFS